ncbi:DUF1616 domain-containing protein [Halopelagius fulvigenes]|uniref:DUF1616 domain-containing protein n=1 Tax=Halopelagius fulvigenes TaxID=1198324 RepID=A0ABD5TZC9_9EURY
MPEVRDTLRRLGHRGSKLASSVRRLRSRGRSLSDAEWTGATVNVVLVLSLLLAPASIAYALSLPDDRYTEFSVLTRDDSGNLVSNEYPRNVERGESVPLVLSIANHEQTGSTYTVVVRLQQVRMGDGGTVAGIETSKTLSRDRVTVAPGGTRTIPYEFVPTMTGKNLRASFLLYRGEPPANPNAESAYRSLHLWMNVSANGAESADELGYPRHPVEPPAD